MSSKFKFTRTGENDLSADPNSECEDSGDDVVEVTPQEIFDKRVDSMKRPPPKRDLAYFVALGLSDDGLNPHRMKCGREVSKSQLEAVFGKEATRSNYRYTDCRTARIVERVEKIWPRCYGRKGMDGVKLISLEFAMGIVAEEHKTQVDWASFAEETNRTQRSKYTKRVKKLLADAEQQGVRISLTKLNVGQESSGRLMKLEDDVDFASMVDNSDFPDSSAGGFRGGHPSSHWCKKQGVEVNQLLQLCSLELDASKQQLEKMRVEKGELADKVRSVRLLLEHVQTSLSEQVRKTQLLEDSEKRTTCNASGELASPKSPKTTDSVPLVDGASDLVEQRIQEKLWKSLVSQHELQYKQLLEQSESQETALKELQQKTKFFECQYAALGEKVISLKKKDLQFLMYPHPLCYPSEPIDPRCDLLRITDCVFCRCGFLYNDVVVASCRHLYHPWCAMVHFRVHTRCFDSSCDVLMSPEWYKSFGFSEFDKNMEEHAKVEGCEDARLQALNLRRQTAIAHCPNLGLTLKEFREPLSGCTGTLSAGESSHAKDRDQSPFKVPSGQGSVPKKNLLRQLGDGDTGISTPAAQPATKSIQRPSTDGIGTKSPVTERRDRSSPSGKRKHKELGPDKYSEVHGADTPASNSTDVAARPQEPPQSESNDVRAFAGQVQTLCREMLNSPLCKKAQGVHRRAHGHESGQRTDQTSSRGIEDRVHPKKTKAGASQIVLKDRFEPRQTRQRTSPEEKTKGNPGEGSKKTKKKKVEFNAADISGGLEVVPVSVCTERSRGTLPRKFVYMKSNVIHEDADLHPISDTLKREKARRSVYTRSGCLQQWFLRRLYRNPNTALFIKECWGACACVSPCSNRVVQQGLKREVQVFWTGEAKGWGVRVLEALPKGSFVFEFVGEILTASEMHERLQNALRTSKQRYIQNVVLDAACELDDDLEDSRTLYLDGTFRANVARLLNHRCWDANLIDVPVLIETEAQHYYHVAFFTTRKVRAMEELTWDYGIDFTDKSHPIPAFKCRCGSRCCRDTGNQP